MLEREELIWEGDVPRCKYCGKIAMKEYAESNWWHCYTENCTGR